jgi:hypothetical protein
LEINKRGKAGYNKHEEHKVNKLMKINKRGKAGYNKQEEHKVNKLMKINKRGYINQDVD